MSGCTYVYHHQLALQSLFSLAGRTNGSLTVTVLAVQGWIHLALHGIHGGWERRPESTDGTLEKSFCIKTSELLQKQGEKKAECSLQRFRNSHRNRNPGVCRLRWSPVAPLLHLALRSVWASVRPWISDWLCCLAP